MLMTIPPKDLIGPCPGEHGAQPCLVSRFRDEPGIQAVVTRLVYGCEHAGQIGFEIGLRNDGLSVGATMPFSGVAGGFVIPCVIKGHGQSVDFLTGTRRQSRERRRIDPGAQENPQLCIGDQVEPDGFRKCAWNIRRPTGPVR